MRSRRSHADDKVRAEVRAVGGRVLYRSINPRFAITRAVEIVRGNVGAPWPGGDLTLYVHSPVSGRVWQVSVVTPLPLPYPKRPPVRVVEVDPWSSSRHLSPARIV